MINPIEDDKYKNRYRIQSARLNGWDYGSHGLYFVTICTKDRISYFGEIKNPVVETKNFASLQTSEIGNVAHNNWLDIPKHFPFVELDEYIVMPNHIHGIIFINKPYKLDWQPNKFGAQSQNLGSIIRGYKVSVKKYATLNNIEFAWQPRYYDRVIRDEKEYINVREYIYNNPNNWLLNKDEVENLHIP